MSEFEWIQRYFAPLAGEGALHLQDDAAIISPPINEQLIVSTDTLNEAVHFKAGTAPDKIAQKALRVNLSDLAAKAAKPFGYTLNLSLPIIPSPNEEWVTRFCEGLKADQANYHIHLLGGDTTTTHGPLSISITAYGSCKQPILRSGAKVGDTLYVSGNIGAGYLGLHHHSHVTAQHYELPVPRLDLIALLQEHATAAMDISDGLVQDLGHLCKASKVGANIQLSQIPLADGNYDRIEQITGGDDYEILFTAPPNITLPACVTAIGHITSGESIQWLDENEQLVVIKKGGWQHF